MCEFFAICDFCKIYIFIPAYKNLISIQSFHQWSQFIWRHSPARCSLSVKDSGPGTWFMQTLEDTLDSSQPEPAKPDNCVSNRKPWNNCLFNFSDCIGSLTGPGSAGVTEWEAAWCHTRHWGYQDLHSQSDGHQTQTHHQGEDSALTCSPHGARAWDWTNNNILTCVTLNVEMITGIVRECGDIFSCGSDPLLAVTISLVTTRLLRSPGYDAGDINEEMARDGVWPGVIRVRRPVMLSEITGGQYSHIRTDPSLPSGGQVHHIIDGHTVGWHDADTDTAIQPSRPQQLRHRKHRKAGPAPRVQQSFLELPGQRSDLGSGAQTRHLSSLSDKLFPSYRRGRGRHCWVGSRGQTGDGGTSPRLPGSADIVCNWCILGRNLESSGSCKATFTTTTLKAAAQSKHERTMINTFRFKWNKWPLST